MAYLSNQKSTRKQECLFYCPHCREPVRIRSPCFFSAGLCPAFFMRSIDGTARREAE